MKFKIAVSPMKLKEKLPQGDPRWGELTTSFVNQELEHFEVLEAIAFGHPVTTWHNGPRKHENFICAQHIGVDMDTDDERSSIETLTRVPFVLSYASIVYATPSHGIAGDRSRIIFLLDECITSIDGYKAAASFIASLFPDSDKSIAEPSRFFYGMADPTAPHWWQPQVLRLADLRIMYSTWKDKQPHRQPQNVVRMSDYRDAKVNIDALLDPVRNARNGDRNNKLHRAAFIAGKDIAAGRLSYDEAVRLLTDAARMTGLPDTEIERTIEKSIERGREAA